jgi:hypothetical protein
MKKVFNREEVETIVTIIALGCLSIMCVFVKYDWSKISEVLLGWH